MYFEKDIFVAVSPHVMFDTDEEDDGRSGSSFTLARGDSIALDNGDYYLKFMGFDTEVSSDLVPDSTAISVAAQLNLTNSSAGEIRGLSPIYVVLQDGQQQFIQNRISDWGLTVTFVGMNVDNGSANFVVEGVKAETEDWVVVQAYEKPFINLVWLGLLVLSGGFVLAMGRRIQDHKNARNRSSS